MKVVINACCGGFSLSPKAVKRLAELQGRDCYFFADKKLVSIEVAEKSWLFFDAYDMADISAGNQDDWINWTKAQKDASNAWLDTHRLDNRCVARDNPLLIKAVEELGSAAASGPCAELKIIEIPDGIQYEIEEYDGCEKVSEVHMSWS